MFKKLVLALAVAGGFAFADSYFVRFSQPSGNQLNFTAYSSSYPNGFSGTTGLSSSVYPGIYTTPYGTVYINNGFLFGYGSGNVYLGAGSFIANSNLSGKVMAGFLKNGTGVSSIIATFNNSQVSISGGINATGTVTQSGSDYLVTVNGCTVRMGYAGGGIWTGASVTQGCDAGVILKEDSQPVSPSGEYMVYVWDSNLNGPWIYRMVLDTSNNQWTLYSCNGSQCTTQVLSGTVSQCGQTNLQDCVYLQGGNVGVYFMPADNQGDVVLGDGTHVVLGYKTLTTSSTTSSSGSSSSSTSNPPSSSGTGSSGTTTSSTSSGSTTSSTTSSSSGSTSPSFDGGPVTTSDQLNTIINTLNSIVNALAQIINNLMNTLNNLITTLINHMQASSSSGTTSSSSGSSTSSGSTTSSGTTSSGTGTATSSGSTTGP